MIADLIARLEQATEGSWELDVQIYMLMNPGYERKPWSARATKQYWFDAEGANTWSQHTPAYSTSIDAALQLVPEGCAWRVTKKLDGAGCYAIIQRREPNPVDGFDIWEETQDVATPALALCIAALKARQS